MYGGFKRKTFYASVVFGCLALILFAFYAIYAVGAVMLLVSSAEGAAAFTAVLVFLVVMIYTGIPFLIFEIISIALSAIVRDGADRAVNIYCIVNIVLGTVLITLALIPFLMLLLI